MAADGKDSGVSQRMAMGMAFGVPVGVVIALLTDNWGLLGVGIALGAAFGAIPPRQHGTDTEAGPGPET